MKHKRKCLFDFNSLRYSRELCRNSVIEITVTCVNSWRISLCLVSLCMTAVVAATTVAEVHWLMSSLTSVNFTRRFSISISSVFHCMSLVEPFLSANPVSDNREKTKNVMLNYYCINPSVL